jgi:hypothetical protein
MIARNQSLAVSRDLLKEVAAHQIGGSHNMSYKALFALALIAPLAFLTQPGIAQERPALHPSWPIEGGVKHQPTRNELRALHQQDVPSSDAREIDRLYNELMDGYTSTHHTGNARMR